MKIYIENVFLNESKLTKITPISITYKNNIISKEFGMYCIIKHNENKNEDNENNEIFFIESTFKEEYKQIKYNNYDFVIDNTIYNKKLVLSQLPVNYINIPIVEEVYNINDSFSLVVIKQNIKQVITDFYFICDTKNTNTNTDINIIKILEELEKIITLVI